MFFLFFTSFLPGLSGGSCIADELPLSTSHAPNPHFTGWSNLLLPGSGSALLGNYGEGAIQAGYELGTFAAGYSLSDTKGFSSLDGISDTFKPYSTKKGSRNQQVSLEQKLTSDILLEFSIKTHIMNTFLAYRDAYKAQGTTEGLDQHSAIEAFGLPFSHRYLSEMDVWLPLLLVAGAVIIDYANTSPDVIQPLNPSSNLLYNFNYGLWQPLGSGYPEEAFYRGFLQHEVTTATSSPLLGIIAQSIAFAFSHEPGNGRYSAGVVGAYLGYLSYKHHGDLGPGVTLHFWGDLLLGIETIILSQKGQRTTSQGGFVIQYNY